MKKLVVVFFIVFLGSCTTYYVPVDSFKRQFEAIDRLPSKEVTTRGPGGGKVTYQTFPLDSIHCVDKNGRSVAVLIRPSLEIGFTDSNNRKVTFYLDLISVGKTSITGVRSRIITSFKKTIPLQTIKTIEIQDGGKKYSYVN